MNPLRRGAAALVRLWGRTRRWPAIAAVYARIPVSWKMRVAQRLLRLATGANAWRVPPAPQAAMQPVTPAPCDDGYRDAVGVNLYGYVRGEFGLAESVRLFAQGLAQAGYPFSLLDFERPLPSRARDLRFANWLAQRGEHPVSVYFVNPDQMLLSRAHFAAQRAAGRYLIGYWYWELEKFPDAWHGALDLVDEVWVASEFVRRSIAAETGKPVLLMPLPIALPAVASDRQRFGLPRDRTVFLFAFDQHSYVQRKNPQALIAAFREAFPAGRRDVQLLIKTLNAEKVPVAHLDLLDAARGDPRIVIRDGHLGRDDTYGLIASVDAWVSLHRSEGFGLGLAEAMALGKPVIATAWSGNMDFMSEREAMLVDYRLVPVPPDAYLHWRGQRWAEPDITHAARHLRALADDPLTAQALGAAAAARIGRQYARSVCTAAVIERLQWLGTNQLAGTQPAPRTPRT